MPAEPFSSFTSRVIPLPAENVDTDQIIPARFLKTTDRWGLSEALFADCLSWLTGRRARA